MKLSSILPNRMCMAVMCLSLLLGTTAAAQTVSLSRTTIAYTTTIALGNSSSPVALTLTNGTAAALTISSISTTDGFSQTNNCVSPIAAAGKCTINVTFTPTVATAYSGSLTIIDDASGSPRTVSLTGTGVLPITVSPSSRYLGNVAVGTTSAPQTFTLRNNGTSAQSVAITPTAPFGQTNNCGGSIAAGATCTVNATLTPVVTGAATGSITFGYSGSGSPQTVSLTGTGVAAFTVSPASLAFGNQALALPSSAKTITIKNNQAGPVAISGVAISGDFSKTTTCGATLAGSGATCTFSVTFTPTATGPRTGSLSFSVGGIAQSVSLSGVGMVQIAVSPASLTFASQVLNSSSAASTVTATNNTAGALSVSGIAISGDFARTTTCGASLNPGASCTFSVTFTPTAAGARTGTLSFTVGSNGLSVNLSGTGALPVSVTPTTLTFAPQALGTASVGQIVTVKNNQTVALTIGSIAVGTNFARTTTCGTTLNANASCTVTVTSVPTVTGALSGNLSISVNAGASPQIVALTGTGVGVATVSPVAIAFGNQATNTTSPAQVITVTNNKTTSLTGLSNSVAGAGFSRSATTCSSTLAASASCTISITFAPTAATASNGTVTVGYTGSGSPQTITLSGTGTAAVVVSPSAIDFGTQALGVATVAQAFTLNNAQNVPLAISSIGMTGVADFTQSNNCGSSLAAKASCTISAIFKPTVAGARQAAISITDDAAGSPQTINLTGTGTAAFTLSPPTLTFNSQLTNTTSAPQTITLTNVLATPVTVSSIVVAAPFAQTNNCTTLAIAASCTVNVTFKPTAAVPYTANLTINAGGTPQVTTLKGAGSATAISVAPTSLSFGNQAIAMASAVKTIVLTNSQNSALVISSISTSLPEYSQTNNCGSSLPATSSCTINVTMTPSSAAAFTGALTITDGGAGSPRNISLTGTGVLPITGTPVTRFLGSVAVGSTGAPQTFTVKNNAIIPLTLGITPTATFGETDNCGATLAAGATCTINATFTPTAVGNATGSIGLTYAGSGSPQTLSVSGTGLVQTQLAPNLSFGNQIVSVPSVAKPVVLKNNQPFPITLTNIALTSGYSQTNNCGSPLAAASSCTFNVVFTPATTGSHPGTLVVSVDQGVSPMTVSFTGSGVIPQATALPTILSFASQAVSTSSSTQTVTLKNNGTTTFTVGSIVASTDFTQTNACSSSLTAGSSCIINVAFAPTATGVRNGTLTITDTANNSPQVVTLGGTATPQLTAIALTPASVSLGIGAQQQYTATATFADNSTADVSNQVTWTSGNPSVVGITINGLASVLGTSNTAIPISASLGTVTSNPPAFLNALSTLPRVCPSASIDMKVLVVNNPNVAYPDLPAIKQILDYVGTPYTVMNYTDVTPEALSDGVCHGFYQGIIMAFGDDIYSGNANLYTTLGSYEQTFHVRQVNWFFNPTPDYGFNYSASSIPDTQTYTGNFTAAAATVFPNINTATPLSFSNAFIYISPLYTPPTGTVTPLVTDASGNVLSAIWAPGNGQEVLSQTFDSNQYLMHNLVLAYGLVNWVTKGVFLGDYHVYAAAQVDDFFIADAEWIPGTSCTNPVTHDRTVSDDPSLPIFRVNNNDMTQLVAWQNGVQSDPLLTGFKLSMAFNGVGTTGNKDWTGLSVSGIGPSPADDLTYNVHTYEQFFHWMTHTFDHPNTLNGLHKSDTGGDTDVPAVDSIDLEILTNLYVASGTTQGGLNLDIDPSDNPPNGAVTPINFTDFNPANMVSPGVTGLNDTLVPTYLAADGIKYVVTDTSVIGQTNNGPNPSPNVGIVNSYAPGIYEVPRYPNNIYYNAANWADDQAEFHCIYGPVPGPSQPPYDNYNAAQILDYTSSIFVVNMLKGDMNPQMFHQPNLHFSDNGTALGLGTAHVSSLISDTYSQTFAKYESLFKLPVLSLTLDQLGESMKARNAYNLAGATGILIGVGTATPSVSISVPPANPGAVISVTGLSSAGPELYGGTKISHIQVDQGQTVTLPLQ